MARFIKKNGGSTMKKILIIIGIVAGVVAALAFGVNKGSTGKVVGEAQYKLEINRNSNEDEVIDIMHKMTHQKIRANKKWGAVPMTLEDINEVRKIVSSSNFSRKKDLLSILDKWKNGDFSTVDEDHNYFWRVQGGNIGEAYGLLNEEEEQQFIRNNFEEYKNVGK